MNALEQALIRDNRDIRGSMISKLSA